MKNKLTDVRDHLIAQLERLGDAEGDDLAREIDRAKAMRDLAAPLIESAKVEVAFLTGVQGAVPTGFLPNEQKLIGRD
jgi:hypothetical protein